MERNVTKRNRFVIAGLLGSLVVFFAMMLGVKNGFFLGLDERIQSLFMEVENDQVLGFFEAVSTLGSTMVIGGGSLVFLLWLWVKKRNYWGMVIFVIGVGGGNLLNKFVKNSMARERPVGIFEAEAASYSFPSGHAMVGLVFYGLLAYFITKELKSKTAKWGIGISVGVLMLIMGISRLALNAHYLTDVIAGYALGAAWLLVCVRSNSYFSNCGQAVDKKAA